MQRDKREHSMEPCWIGGHQSEETDPSVEDVGGKLECSIDYVTSMASWHSWDQLTVSKQHLLLRTDLDCKRIERIKLARSQAAGHRHAMLQLLDNTFLVLIIVHFQRSIPVLSDDTSSFGHCISRFGHNL